MVDGDSVVKNFLLMRLSLKKVKYQNNLQLTVNFSNELYPVPSMFEA